MFQTYLVTLIADKAFWVVSVSMLIYENCIAGLLLLLDKLWWTRIKQDDNYNSRSEDYSYAESQWILYWKIFQGIKAIFKSGRIKGENSSTHSSQNEGDLSFNNWIDYLYYHT